MRMVAVSLSEPAAVGVVGYLPAQHAAPEARQTKRVVRMEANCQELTSHGATHL